MTRTSFERAATYFTNDMIPPLRQQLIGRKLFAKVDTIPPGKFEYEYDKVTELGNAIIDYALPESDKWDDILIANDNIKLAVISKQWKIPLTKWKAYMTEGKDLSTTASRSAAQVIGLADDDLCIQYWKPDGSNAKINGLYASAGSSYSTTADFGNYGKAIEAVAGGLANMAGNNVPITATNWNLTLNPVQYYELIKSMSTTGYPELPQVEKMLNPAGGSATGQVLMSPDITAATGLLSPVDPAGNYIRLVVAQEPKVVLGTDSKKPDISPIYATTYEALAPLVLQPYAVASLTSI